jgi:hypothetical protein
METEKEECLPEFGQSPLHLRIYEILLVSTGLVAGLMIGLFIGGLR